MSWSVEWFVIRDRPLIPQERRGLAEHVLEIQDEPWASGYDLHLAKMFRDDSLLACGGFDLQVGTTADAERLCAALTKLRAVAPGAEVRVRDDFGSIGWNEATSRFELCGQKGDVPPTPELKEGWWIRASSMLPRREPKVHDASSAGQLFDLLTHCEKAQPRDDERVKSIVAQLAALPPGEVAAAGLARWTKAEYYARDAVCKALRALPDASGVRDPLIQLWSMKPPRGYWHSDLREPHGIAASKDPGLLEFLCRDLMSQDDGHRDRLGYTAETIGNSRRAEAVPSLIRRLRADRQASGWVPWRADCLRAISMIGSPAAFATVVLEIASNDTIWMYGAVEGLVSCGGERAVPWLLRVLPTEQNAERVLEALAKHADRREVAAAVERFHARSSDPFERLFALGGGIRAKALEELFARRDPSLILALSIADRLHHAIAEKTGWPASVPDWDAYKSVIPDEWRYGRRHEWIDKSVASLPPQVVPPALEEVKRIGFRAAAARLPYHRIVLGAEERAGLEAEEEQALR